MNKEKFRLLILAGVHGQEPQSCSVLEALIDDFELKEEGVFDTFEKSTATLHCIAIPKLNLFGLANKIRGNKNGVDLNRNLPAKNWSKDFKDDAYYPGEKAGSELETKKCVELIEDLKPNLIISIHTNHFVTVSHPPQVNFDGELEGRGFELAKKLSEIIDLEFTHDIGYSTPGSLGSYAKDLKIPCITLELDDKLSNQDSVKLYTPSLREFIGII